MSGERVDHGGFQAGHGYSLQDLRLCLRQGVVVHNDDRVRPPQLRLEGHQAVVGGAPEHVAAL